MKDVIRTDGSGAFERWGYEYSTVANDFGGSASLISKVSLQKGTSASGPWTTIRAAEYAYYTGATTADDNAYGRLGDLKLVTIKDYQHSASGDVVNQDYYRYNNFGSNSYYTAAGPTNDFFTTGGTDSTFVHPHYGQYGAEQSIMSGLKSVFEGASFSRLTAARGTVDQFDDDSDASVNPYADLSFKYERIDPGQAGYPAQDGHNTIYHVVQETVSAQGCTTCSSGLGTYKFDYGVGTPWDQYNSYDYNTNDHKTNIWSVRTTEYLPDTTNADTDGDGIVDADQWADNDENIVYTNELGQVILSVVLDKNGTASDTSDDKKYLTYFRYDNQGRLLYTATRRRFRFRRVGRTRASRTANPSPTSSTGLQRPPS